MYFTLMGKLNARRKNLATQDAEKGFTLIELLVVVIIIGILAAIAIPVYLGVQNNAKNAADQSDITNMKTAMISLQTNGTALSTLAGNYGSGTGQTALSSDLTGAGATQGTNTSALKVYVSGTSFCIQGTSSVSATTNYAATDSLGVAKGTCNTTTAAFIAG